MKKIFVLAFAISLAFNMFTLIRTSKEKSANYPAKVGFQQYEYLARRIFVEDPNDIVINFVDLRERLRKYVREREEKTGIYFEYLPSGNSIGVNEKEPFFRASLVKVPAVMRVYKLIEEGKLKKDELLTVKQVNIDPTYGELWKNGAGTKITVEEAIRLAISESDNTAYEVLNERVNGDILDAEAGQEKIVSNVYDFLDIPRVEVGPNQQITAKNFSSILKSLFFSAYLSYENSNELLDLMSRSTFDEGIRFPVSEEVKVAHKFGIYNLESENLEVHSDCGIFYVPSRTYILCVMVNSGNIEMTSGYMRDISEMVYEFVKSANYN